MTGSGNENRMVARSRIPGCRSRRPRRHAAAIDALVKAAPDVQRVDLDLSGAQPALEVIWGASHAAVVRDFDGAQLAALDPGLLRLVITAQGLFPRANCRRPMADMRALSQQMHSFHGDFDLLLTPTIPITAFAAGVDTPGCDALSAMVDWTPLTWPFNLTRQPAASVPCGFVEGCRSACRSWGRCLARRKSSAPAAASRGPAPAMRGRTCRSTERKSVSAQAGLGTFTRNTCSPRLPL